MISFKVITASDLVCPGRVALMRNTVVVWQGPLAAPWEDVDCNVIVVNPEDFERLKQEMQK